MSLGFQDKLMFDEKSLSLSFLCASSPPSLLFHIQELGVSFFHMPRGVALSSRVKIKEKKKKAADQGVDLAVQVKAIKVFKAKILLEKKNFL